MTLPSSAQNTKTTPAHSSAECPDHPAELDPTWVPEDQQPPAPAGELNFSELHEDDQAD